MTNEQEQFALSEYEKAVPYIHDANEVPVENDNDICPDCNLPFEDCICDIDEEEEYDEET